jgi:hypothetical protein
MKSRYDETFYVTGPSMRLGTTEPADAITVIMTNSRRHHSTSVRRTAVRLANSTCWIAGKLDRELVAILRRFPRSSTHDLMIHLSPDILVRSSYQRAMLYNAVSTALSRMLARNAVAVALDKHRLAHWSLEDGALIPRE